MELWLELAELVLELFVPLLLDEVLLLLLVELDDVRDVGVELVLLEVVLVEGAMVDVELELIEVVEVDVVPVLLV